jgi:ABC-type dipeptide/oligopeptide/nickel transport system permease component
VIPYIIRRLLLLVPVLLIVGVIVFLLVHLAPGDPASTMLGVGRDDGAERGAAGAARAK